jgi:acetyl CoA:N6-hydroxylysine acetyl transferase
MALAFRPLDLDADLALVHGWMQEPHVAPWWELEGPAEGVRAYLEAQSALAHLDCWIVIEDEGWLPVAYVETYRVPQDPVAAYYEAEPGDRGFHLLVGPPELLGTGLAQAIVCHLVRRLLGQFGITRVVCEPDVRNARMLAFCRALGGEELATLQMPGRTAVLFAWTREPWEVAA